MKKFKIFSVVFLLVSVSAFGAFRVYTRSAQDRIPPMINCESNVLTVSVDADEGALLQGVTAADDRSGDVTDTLVVENMSAFTEENTRIITYAAVDDSKNVGRNRRILIYEDYEEPVFNMTGPLCFAAGETVNPLVRMTADSVLDGDLTSYIKYSLEKSVDFTTEGEYPVEFRVMDSGSKMVYLNTWLSICDRSELAINVKLSKYLVRIKVGDSFNPVLYYAGSDKEGELKINSYVNTAKAGTYYVDYIVDGQLVSGKSRLVVVVEEEQT